MFGGIFGRDKQEPAQVSPEVAAALVRADESVRRGTEELGYATAEFGEVAARELGEALTAARGRLQEAFRLNSLLLDDEPETPEQRQQLEAAAMAAAEDAQRLVHGPAATLAARRAALRDAPASIARLRAEAADVSTRVDEARAAVVSLSDRYDAAAVVAVRENAEQAQALLQFTERSLQLAERRHADGRGDEAVKAVQVASDSVRRAHDLLDAVTGFEVEAVHAESTLAAVLADSQGDIAEARRLLAARPDPALVAAADALEQAVTDASATEATRDPFTALSRLRAANTALEQLVDEQRSRPERERMRAHLEAAGADADRQVALARALIWDHPGQVGPEARTRLAQAERLLDGVTSISDPAAGLAELRRAADLAAAAADAARRDLSTSSHQSWDARQSDWGGRRGGVEGVLGGVLGGMVLGGILDDFDLDFD